MTRKWLCAAVVVAIFGFSTLLYAEDNSSVSTSSQAGQTAYESHKGLFLKKPVYVPEDPLLGKGKLVNDPLFTWVDKFDGFVGERTHAKEHGEGSQKSFITTEDRDGAKLGFEF